LSIIVPTRNEAGNIGPLLSKIEKALDEENIEIIFVDDSTDDTPRVVEASTLLFPALNVRLIHRTEAQRTGGLGGAVVLGMQNARSDFACVMDGDLQHPPELLPVMLNNVRREGVDMVIATRRSGESQVKGLSTTRNFMSRGLDLATRVLFPRQLHGVSDPLSGSPHRLTLRLQMGADVIFKLPEFSAPDCLNMIRHGSIYRWTRLRRFQATLTRLRLSVFS
jgi:dolichol-phosphate mannosyltransferase